MTLLKRIEEKGLAVNWGTVWTGWIGPKGYQRMISADEVSAFAGNLVENDKNASPKIAYLAGSDESELEKINQLLFDIQRSEKFDLGIEERKWRFVLLDGILSGLPEDPLYGTLELVDFWSKWDFPLDSPISGSHLPQNYSNDSYAQLVKSHRDWLETERKALQDAC